jgi:hypothetical protein
MHLYVLRIDVPFDRRRTRRPSHHPQGDDAAFLLSHFVVGGKIAGKSEYRPWKRTFSCSFAASAGSVSFFV